MGEELRQAGFGPRIVEAQLGKLERTVGRLEWQRAASTWSGYADRSHHTSSDLDAKERFVREVVAARPRRQVIDLGANDGRFSRIAAAHADLVLALALVHHLAISATVPLAEIVAMLADLGGEVVIELPTPDDEMVKRLLRNKRRGLFDHYQLDAFVAAAEARYEVCRREELPSGTRHLFHLRPRR